MTVDDRLAGNAMEAPLRRDPRPVRVRAVVWAFHIGFPLLVLQLLVGRPSFDLRWEDHQAHFWLVLVAAGTNAILGFRMAEDARRRVDARLFLVAMAFLCSSGFLALHALATPNVLLHGANAGFVIATPVGLVLAATFAALSTIEFSSERSSQILSRQGSLRIGVPLLLVGWAIVSLLGLPPLDKPILEEEAHGPLVVLAIAATVLYVLAGARYYLVHRRRPSVLLVSLITAFFLLAEAAIAVSIARSWRASWWEWHLLMAAGFGFVAYTAYLQYGREGSARGLFAAISLEQNLRAVHEEYGAALESLVSAIDAQFEGAPASNVTLLAVRLGDRFGLTEGQTRVLTRAAEALAGEREEIRRLGALVAVGQEASVVGEESTLLDRALDILRAAFRHDELRVGLLSGGHVRYLAADDGDPTSGARVTEAHVRIREQALGNLTPAEGDVDGHRLFVVPLTVKGRPAGVLEVSRIRGNFAERDVAMIQSLASQLSIALENARLYHQLDGLFRQYMSPDVATALLADPDQAALGGAIIEVTVLFADLRGFTPFSEQTSPDQVVALLNTHFGLVVPAILAEGGTVLQFVGDAIMAIFNAPARQEDHAIRAARSALKLQSAIESVAADNPTWPRFRVGVNTGPALVGNIGSAEMRNFTAIGDTINLAARLETSAEVGQVVLGRTTYEQIQHLVVARPLGSLQLKGKAAPVEAFELVGLREDTDQAQRSPSP